MIRNMKYTDFLKLNLPKNYVVLFSGGLDPATGKSWCYFCKLVHPIIEQKFFPLSKNQNLGTDS